MNVDYLFGALLIVTTFGWILTAAYTDYWRNRCKDLEASISHHGMRRVRLRVVDPQQAPSSTFQLRRYAPPIDRALYNPGPWPAPPTHEDPQQCAVAS